LAEYRASSSVNESDLTLIIPKLTIVDMQKIAQYAISKNTEQLQVQYSDNLVSFACTVDGMKLVATSLLIQGNFPDYERPEIMPMEFNTTMLLDKNDCEKAIRKIGILTRDINNFIQIETNKDSINITSGKTDKGNANTSTAAIITGNDVQFGINGKYITDFTRIMTGSELIFNIVDNHKPLIIIDKNDTAYRYVVRPLINN
jgi:DNA polymerase III sliding clamp (beta) subunit (PCNA family)